MRSSTDIKDLAASLSKFQSQIKSISMNAEAKIEGRGGSGNAYSYKYKYADLAAVWDAIRKPLTDNGLAFIQLPEISDGKVDVEGVVLHNTGQFISDIITMIPTKSDPQSVGSAITYARRYQIAAMLGLVTDEDDDGGKATATPKTTTKAENPSESQPTGTQKHFCKEHNTDWFKTEKMRGYSHPVKGAFNDKGKQIWCNEPTEKPDQTPVKQEEPEKEPDLFKRNVNTGNKSAPSSTVAGRDPTGIISSAGLIEACKEDFNLTGAQVFDELAIKKSSDWHGSWSAAYKQIAAVKEAS